MPMPPVEKVNKAIARYGAGPVHPLVSGLVDANPSHGRRVTLTEVTDAARQYGWNDTSRFAGAILRMLGYRTTRRGGRTFVIEGDL